MQVLRITLCDSTATVCNATAAVNSSINASVEVQNIGTLSGNFSVAIDDCSYPVAPAATMSNNQDVYDVHSMANSSDGAVSQQFVVLVPGEVGMLSYEVRFYKETND